MKSKSYGLDFNTSYLIDLYTGEMGHSITKGEVITSGCEYYNGKVITIEIELSIVKTMDL